jgi:hypothetical protein
VACTKVTLESKVYFFFRIFWILSLTVAFCLSAFTISVAYKNWQENPVIITFAGRYESIKTVGGFFLYISASPAGRNDMPKCQIV